MQQQRRGKRGKNSSAKIIEWLLGGLLRPHSPRKPDTKESRPRQMQKHALKKVITHPRFGEIVVSRTQRAKRISVSVRPPDRVRLTIPAGYSIDSGLRFLAEKEAWIAQALERIAQKHPVRVIEPPYSTKRHTLEFRQSPDCINISAKVTADTILVSFPLTTPHTSAQVQEVAREAIIKALRAEAKELLPTMVATIAARHGFRHGKVTVRTTKSRWGSCSSNNDISLSLFLMYLPDHLIEYIIIHELCHTRHKDHSAKFHALVDTLLGGREKELRHELRSYNLDVL